MYYIYTYIYGDIHDPKKTDFPNPLETAVIK